MASNLYTILSIAASDPTSGAGIQADIKAAAYCGVYALTAVTAVTAQNSKSLLNLSSVSPDLLKSQLTAIADDVTPDAIKIGMIGSLENGYEIVKFLKSFAYGIPVVIDPVMKASVEGTGSDKNELADFYRRELLPLASVATPNIAEAALLTEERCDDIRTSAATLISECRCRAVVIKGGHGTGDILTDLLAYISDSSAMVFKSCQFRRVDTINLHGTGCTYASLFASYLAQGNDISAAFDKTEAAISSIILASGNHTLGKSEYGPLNTLGFCTTPLLS